jgi:hypothetical protein
MDPFWVIFAIFMIVVVGVAVTSPFWGMAFVNRIAGISGGIKNGIPGDAVIQSIAETGMTISSSSTGPEAPVYKLGLLVTPPGGAPYQVEAKTAVPRLFVPMTMPGASIGVIIDPADPMNVQPDFSRLGRAGSTAGAGAAGGVHMSPAGPGVFSMNFDASGQPDMGDVSALATGVRSGSVNTIKGTAKQILATGTHGTAVITTAMPLGKRVRDIDPNAEPSHLDNPLWIFTLEVSLAGQTPFPAVFGHHVPLDKVALLGPGVKLAVAVDERDKNQDVAIDWDKSPIA